MEKLARGTVKCHSPQLGDLRLTGKALDLSHAVSCGRVESGSQAEPVLGSVWTLGAFLFPS